MTTSARFARAGSVHDGDLGRSGPKRLDNGRCGVALTTPSRDEASIAVPHPQVPGGEVSFHARQPRAGARRQVRRRPP